VKPASAGEVKAADFASLALPQESTTGVPPDTASEAEASRRLLSTLRIEKTPFEQTDIHLPQSEHFVQSTITLPPAEVTRKASSAQTAMQTVHSADLWRTLTHFALLITKYSESLSRMPVAVFIPSPPKALSGTLCPQPKNL
jgi:hypothetical protein